MKRRGKLDIWSKGEVVAYVQNQERCGEVKDCALLKVEKGHTNAYYPRCLEDYASRERARNVVTDPTAYHGPSSYWWLRCPLDCPKYRQATDFVDSLTRKPTNTALLPQIHYVDPLRLDELRDLESQQFDFTKLIALCEDINRCYSAGALFGTVVLVRAILDHVPPLFGVTAFKEVANNWSGSSKSFGDSMRHLEKISRKVADAILHTQIRRQEVMPTPTQVDFRSDLDILLQEIVRLYKK